ncbi:MAG TPA: sigma-54 dependent transcriptional regulator [Syntrophales bacterium]|nr:sigma-54 dependent transcriptional regulator [Syntrophales bacterium]
MTPSVSPYFPVLLVDDELQALNSFEMALRSAGLNNFIRCQDSRDVMPVISKADVEVVLLDLMMPHLSGERILAMISSDHPGVPVIVVTGANDVDTAVECMKAGAFDYIVKPVEKSRLVASVKRAIEIRELQRENSRLKRRVFSDALEQPEAFAEILTCSESMRAIFQYIEAIAGSIQPVAVTGETGVGKELVAKALHKLRRRDGHFVPVNVAGLDDNVFSDTLFGHRKGAFTGADQIRSGLVEQAAGGTLFLDEIGDLSFQSQVKLLRLLQDGEFFPLGSDVAKRSDARIIVATNQDLGKLQESGKFRMDLYYRLCVHHIHIPPLRERKEDLPVLVDHYLGKAAETLDKKKPVPPKELISLLRTYNFPGNVRELQAIITNAVSAHKSGMLSLNVFKAYIQEQRPGHEGAHREKEVGVQGVFAFPEPLPTFKQMEEQLIAEAMKRANGNQAAAALSLGITRQALNRRLKISGA